MRPLLPVLLAFMAGIICAGELEASYGYAYGLLALSAVYPAFLFVASRRFSRFAAALPFFALGVLFTIPYNHPALPSNHISRFADEAPPGRGGNALAALGHAIEGVIVSSPEVTRARTRLNVDAQKIFGADRWTETTGIVQLTVNGAIEGYGPGDTIRFFSKLYRPYNFGNPGEFDYERWLAVREIHVKGFVRSAGLISRTKEAEASVAGSLHGIRVRIRKTIEGSGAANTGLLEALITGERGGIPPGVRESFEATGTAHLLAISGLHVGIVAVFFYGFFLFLLKRSERLMLAYDVKTIALLLSLGPALAYAVVSGFATSTQRAAVMLAAFVLTLAIGRGRDYINTLCLAALVILALSPYSLYEASFQLSFVAVVGIVYLVPRLREFFARKARDRDADPLAILRAHSRFFNYARSIFHNRMVLPAFTMIAAGLATAPVIAFHFHRASLAGLLANIVVVPLATLAIPVLLIGAFLSPFWEGGAGVLISTADLLLGAITVVVGFFSKLPYSSFWVSTPTILEIALFYAVIYMAANLRKGRRYIYAAGFFAALLAGDAAYWRFFYSHGDELRVTFISVGQGDSTLVEFPGGETMLIDGGGSYAAGFDIGESVVAPLLWHKKIRRIDYMVLSHAQLDHMGGLGFIASNFSVGEFWWAGAGRLGGLGNALERNKARKRLVGPEVVELTSGGVRVEAFRPYSDPAGEDLNNMSVVVRLVYGDRGFLFPGDLAGAGEAAAVALGRDITADVLKAPHHGSKYSSSPEFIEKVAPSVVVVSAGRDNPFGFPHEETLKRYSKAGLKVLRTDTSGAVAITTDGRAMAGSAWLTGKAR